MTRSPVSMVTPRREVLALMGLKFWAVACASKEGTEAAMAAARAAYSTKLYQAEPDDCLQVIPIDDYGVVVIRPISAGYLVMNALWAIAKERTDVQNISFHSGSMLDEEMSPITREVIAMIERGETGSLKPFTRAGASDD